MDLTKIATAILAHPSAHYMRPESRAALERFLQGSGSPSRLLVEYSAWARGGNIELTVDTKRYGEDKLIVEINWPGCGATESSQSGAFFAAGSMVSALAAMLQVQS